MLSGRSEDADERYPGASLAAGQTLSMAGHLEIAFHNADLDAAVGFDHWLKELWNLCSGRGTFLSDTIVVLPVAKVLQRESNITPRPVVLDFTRKFPYG